MEPRLFRRGDLTAKVDATQRMIVLQWSHAFSGVETTKIIPQGWSEDPLQWSHAFSGVETKVTGRLITDTSTFNGATPFQAWRPEYEYGAAVPDSVKILQWSHAFSGVETPGSTVDAYNRVVLQWSHAFSGVETTGNASDAVSVAYTFNGATPFQAWRPDGKVGFESERRDLQWSHAFSGVETASPSARRRYRVTFESPLLGTPKIKSHERALRSVWRPCPAENLGSLPPSSAYGMRCHHLTSRKDSVLKGFPDDFAIRQWWPSFPEAPPSGPETSPCRSPCHPRGRC